MIPTNNAEQGLDSVVKSAEKWLTFGQYRPLEDSSDLNFDLIDVSSVTDIMQVWFMVLNSFGRLHCYTFVPLSLLYYSSFLLPFSFSLSLSPWRTWFSSKLSGVLWRWGGKRKESLQVRLWNLNICIKKVDAKCWLAEMTLVVTSLTLARVFQCPLTFALVSASRWLAEIWQFSRRGATGNWRWNSNSRGIVASSPSFSCSAAARAPWRACSQAMTHNKLAKFHCSSAGAHPVWVYFGCIWWAPEQR